LFCGNLKEKSDLMLKIYFMGSGNIAVPVLETLAADTSGVELLGVATQPDRPAGRKCLPQPTPVGAAARALGLAVDKPERASDPGFVEKLARLEPDFVVVVAYGQLLKQELLDVPKCGCVNIHASLLPRYRGASPITAAIARREEVTGVTFMKMARRLDAGDIYKTFEYPLLGNERCDTLELALGDLAAEHVVATLSGIASGALKGREQDESLASMTRKIRKNDGRINWNWRAETVEAVTRAFYPWPGALMTLLFGDREEQITVHSARVHSLVNAPAGSIVRADKNGFIVAAGKGAVELLEITPAGRKRMTAAAYLNGCKIANATVKVNME